MADPGRGGRAPSKRPAFNPGLLASPFYGGATAYGGAGSSNAPSPSHSPSPSPSPSLSHFYEQRRGRVLPPPSGSDASAPSSRTARRIWELLANYSSPISDARRAGTTSHPPTPTPTRTRTPSFTLTHTPTLASASNSSPGTSKLQPLRIPPMAALVSLKRNNRRVESAQAAIAASLSSSAPYHSNAPNIPNILKIPNILNTLNTPNSDNPPNSDNLPTPHSNKIRHRLTGRNRDRELQREWDMPSPVHLPDITLDMSGATLPNFASQPSLKRPRAPHANGPVAPFKFATPIVADVDEVPTKRFHFSDPLDVDDPKVDAYKLSKYSLHENEVTEAADNAKRKISDGRDVVPAKKLNGGDTEYKIPTFSWNGVAEDKLKKSEETKLPDKSAADTAPITTTAPPSLASFVKKQQSRWECDSCLARNDNDKDKCVCCEAAKPGAKIPTVTAPAPAAQLETKTTTPSGFYNFIQKQQSQWECSCCLTRNDSSKMKCVCCEASKPGTENEAVKSTAFNFGSPQASTFKFGIDKADIPASSTTATSSDNILSESKASSIPSTGFVFGIPTPAATAANPETTKTPEIKFGLPNGNVPLDSDKKKSEPSIVPNIVFGIKKNETSGSTAPVFSFGFKPTEKESPKVTDAPIKPTFVFTSPQLKPATEVQSTTPKEKTDSVVPIAEVKTVSPDEPKPVLSPVAVSSPATISVAKDSQSLFSFGGTPAKPPSVFGTAPKFNFGPPVSSTVTKPETDSPFKPTGMFSFGNKTTTPSIPTTDPLKSTSSTTPKSLFSMPASNSPATLFPNTSTSIQPLSKVASPEVTPVKDMKKIINSPFSNPISSLGDKPKDQLGAAPVFNFTGAPSTPNAVPNLFKTTASPALPVFSFGASIAKSDQPAPTTLFGSPQTNSSSNIFGSQIGTGDVNKTTSNPSFKATTTPISTFAPVTGNIFGSSVSNTGPQIPSTNLFANPQSAENKPPPIFGSQLNSTNLPQPLPTSSIFSQPSTFNSTFNAGSIFGNPPTNNASPQQATSVFGTQQPINKPATAPEPSVNAFMSKPQSPSTNIFGSALPTGAPSISTGGIFGSHPAVPTPALGASIPFGEAAQVSQPAQNAPFKFGESNPNQPPIGGFGQVPPAVGSASLFSFGSPSPQAPVNSQFNFSMGAPTPQFPPAPGANPTMGARRYKIAVRRNVPR